MPCSPPSGRRTASRSSLDALGDLDDSLRRRGGALVVRRGNVVAETYRVAVEAGAEAVFVSEDVSAYAQERERRLRRALAAARIELEVFPGVTVVPPGDLAPAGADHYRVFTPYWRRWREQPRRACSPLPSASVLPDGVEAGALPRPASSARARPLPRCRPAARLPAGDGSRSGSTTVS